MPRWLRIGKRQAAPDLVIANQSLRHSVVWRDQPYGTLVLAKSYASSSLFVPIGDIGKRWLTSSGGQLQRKRVSENFAIPSGQPTPVILRLNIELSLYENQIESFRPAVYVSASDDSGGSAGWEDNLDDGPYYLTYGTSGVQSVDLPPSMLVAGQSLSLVIGNEYEFLGTGAGSGSANFDEASFAVEPSATLELLY